MKRYSSMTQIRNDIRDGIKIYWSSDAYTVFEEPLHSLPGSDMRKAQDAMSCVDDGWMIVCRCTENYFGGALQDSEITACYSKGEQV